MNDEPALAELLSSLFVQASLLRSWLRATFGVGFEDQLPGEIAPKTMVVDQATRLLFAAGLVNHELFEKLECREPSRAVDIWKVARACGVAPPSAQLERPAAHEGLAITVNLPPRVPGFVGRRGELAKLADLVESGLPAAVVQAPGAVTGLGGVGKTALVTQYVYANLVKFDCVVWLAAEGDDLPDRIAAVAPRIAPDLPVGLDVEGQAREVMMRLASMRRSLLVLDSVEHPENYLRWIPQTGNCQVLITSRRRDLHGVTRLDLEVLPADDALALLLGPLSYAEPELESARQLCVEFECLAVALALANRPLALGTWTPSQLLEWVREEGPTRWSNDAADVHGGVPGGIAGLFWHSEALLTAGKTQTDRWAHAMLMVGCFAADVAIEGEMLGIAAADYLETAQPRFIVRRALSRLYALGWISAGVGADVRIHRMVKDYFRSHASLEAQLAWGRAVTSRSLSETTNTDRLEEHRAHLRSLVEATRTSLDALQGERAREAAALMGMLDRFNRHVYRTSADRLLTAVLNLSMYLSPPQHWEEFRGERPGRSLPDELRQSHPQFAEVFSAGRQLVEQTHVTSILVGLAQSYLREVPV
ncbi:MAG: hypothetical protein H6716_28235, partial [Polyangiaceae bacterium]|nr:hypothetical protein [Polyangiaceae bacterium]